MKYGTKRHSAARMSPGTTAWLSASQLMAGKPSVLRPMFRSP